MDMDLDVMYDDVRVDEKILGFVEEEGIFEIFEILEGLVYKMVDVWKTEIWNPNNEVSRPKAEIFLV